jgi:UDP-N-acetyl-D-glucosamine dehydrogenase
MSRVCDGQPSSIRARWTSRSDRILYAATACGTLDPVSEAAEVTKLAERTFRDGNIAPANQFAIFADSQGIDVHKVIEACNSRAHSHAHWPGVAVGGDYVPVDPHVHLSTDPGAEVVRTARALNASMPAAYVSRLEAIFGGLAERRVVILGAA